MYKGGTTMCYVSSTEVRNNFAHYLKLSESEDVFVTVNKEVVAVITNPKTKALEEFEKCRGYFKDIDTSNIDYKEMIGEEIMKKCGY